MQELLEEFSTLTKQPEHFLAISATTSEKLKAVTKRVFDTSTKCLPPSTVLPITELLVENFDNEQIWQELELLNDVEFPSITKALSRATARSQQLRLPVQSDGEDSKHAAKNGGVALNEEEDSGQDDEGLNADDDDVEDMEDDDGDDQDHNIPGEDEEDSNEDDRSVDDESGGEEPLPERPRGPRSQVDDQFFRLDELEQFLERQDRQFDRERLRKPDQDDDTGVDLFTKEAGEESASEDDDEEEKIPMFEDFFDPPAGIDQSHDDGSGKAARTSPVSDTLDRRKDLLASDSEGEDADHVLGRSQKHEVKSTLEARQERLKARITQLEEENLAERPWQLRGETTAAGRHENALLEEYVDFEQTRRAPVTTAEVTAQIERLILRRIKDAAFDDVERKVKPVNDPYDFKKRLVMDQEKSKLSLAQIYEQEYLKQKSEAETKPEVDLSLAHDEVADIPKEHEEIKTMMTALFAKLDTLTHFHYQPKQASAEVRIISKLPSIAMEEVTPLAASNATLLAPEEIKDKKRSQLLAKEERTDTDKKRERRKKKRLQSAKARAREQKERALAGQASEKSGVAAQKRLAEAHVARAVRQGTVSRADERPGKKALKSSAAFFSQLQEQAMASKNAAATTQQPVKKKQKRGTAEHV